jgi:hypothetical protein
MDKRLAKRHKRQVARAAERVKISEPDVRTPEQIQAAREASRATANFATNTGLAGAQPNNRGNRPPASGSAAKTSV